MTTFESLEEAQEFFKADRFADISYIHSRRFRICSDVQSSAQTYSRPAGKHKLFECSKRREAYCKGFHQEKWQNLFNHQC